MNDIRLNIQKGEIYNGNKINLIESDYSDNQIFYLIPYDNIDLELKIEMEEKELHDSIMEEIGKSNIINFITRELFKEEK